MSILGNIMLLAGIALVNIAGFSVSTALGLIIVGVELTVIGLMVCAVVMAGKIKK